MNLPNEYYDAPTMEYYDAKDHMHLSSNSVCTYISVEMWIKNQKNGKRFFIQIIKNIGSKKQDNETKIESKTR